ncbi:MAG: potassium-transporting ATPase subunit KdpB [Cyanobacteria bacterium NC_groundwater_1444_Ag_S-0.65um_54_12]|nr:potassium-transporting ATPase subunit KdpB [Cyanobacteria bacterium NC_groundwater_1444_Ag_S-0.65um_54_12]
MIVNSFLLPRPGGTDPVGRPPRAERRHTPKVDTSGLYRRALVAAFRKLDPRVLVKNPVMFVVEIGTVLMLLATLAPDLFGPGQAGRGYNVTVTLVLLLTLLFANFAEAVAEGRGKAQADSLRKIKGETTAHRRRPDGTIEDVGSSSLHKGDLVRVDRDEIIPGDGEVMEGVAYVDESAITGESAPVIKEPGSDIASSVIGGTKVVSDHLIIRITADPGQTFLDRMISLVEGARRQKTPNEIALTVLLAVLTLIFLLVTIALGPYAAYSKVPVPLATLVALLICLIPTTIGGLLSSIGIAGMDRVAKFNVIAMSGKAIEAAGDIDTLILDKTGTITFGNRLAADYLPVGGQAERNLAESAMAASWQDQTPEGRSIVAMSARMGLGDRAEWGAATGIEFSAQTRMSGVDLPDGTSIRKGAADAIKRYTIEGGGRVPPDLDAAVRTVAELGGTPLVVVRDMTILGVIYLKDTIKPRMRERFEQLRRMGIRTVMCTGDNPITARVIAQEAGVDDFMAESKPEDKIRYIREEQAKGKLVAMSGDGTNDAPALAQADVGLAMNSGTHAAKEAANMVDLDSDPTKIIDVITIGKQLLITRGALTTFSLANDIAKYFAIIPAIFATGFPQLQALNVMRLANPESAIVSALVFNALVIPALIPLALKGVKPRVSSAEQMLLRNVLLYGMGGIIVPFIGIKLIDLVVGLAMR